MNKWVDIHCFRSSTVILLLNALVIHTLIHRFSTLSVDYLFQMNTVFCPYMNL